MTLSLTQLRNLARSAGFSGRSGAIAAAVAMAESGGNPQAVGDVQYGGSYGLWQINAPAHPEYSQADLLTPLGNARAAFAISVGGSNWTPWTTYRTGAYAAYLPMGGSTGGSTSQSVAVAALAGAGALVLAVRLGYIDRFVGWLRGVRAPA